MALLGLPRKLASHARRDRLLLIQQLIKGKTGQVSCADIEKQ